MKVNLAVLALLSVTNWSTASAVDCFTSSGPRLSSESRAGSDFSSRLLAPIGRHRTAYVASSKGKRNKKRKRQEASNADLNESDAPPPIPEISSHLLVGLASITRYLELIASARTADGSYEKSETSLVPASCESGTDLEHDSSTKIRHLAAIFVCRPSQPSVLHAHLPQLVAVATLRNPHLQPTRLVQLPQGSENRLSSSLGLPRASFIGILEDAPHSEPLLELVQDKVPIVEVPWLEEAQKAQYKSVKINTILTTAPVGKNK
jgi:ribonuclease P/MRP protein subunit POP3